ncbi:MAG: NADH-ubiquinone oxidoreductase-F iron-sulfur binding region domain-containing protein [Syntrophobacteraceae bacterium]
MMELLKNLTQGKQNKPRGATAKEMECTPSGPVAEVLTPKRFCDPESKVPCITVCASKAGCECDSEGVRQAFVDEIARQGLSFSVGKGKVGCGGKCKKGPFVGFPQKGYFYLGVKPDNVAEIVEKTLVEGYVLFPFLSVNPDRSYRSDLYYEKDTGLLASMTDDVCMVQVAKYFLDFEEGLSCGKCVPCRIGMKRMSESVEKIVAGQGTAEDMDQIRDLCKAMMDTPLCEFAMTSSRPVLSAITHFEDEFKAHVERQECPAGACSTLVEIQRKRAVRERLRGKTKTKKK